MLLQLNFNIQSKFNFILLELFSGNPKTIQAHKSGIKPSDHTLRHEYDYDLTHLLLQVLYP